MTHLYADQYAVFPRWDKRVRKLSLVGYYPHYQKGVKIMRDVEWTGGTVPLPDPQPSNRPKNEIWHIGKSGSEIFLTEYTKEQSWVLFKGISFNYKCDI